MLICVYAHYFGHPRRRLSPTQDQGGGQGETLRQVALRGLLREIDEQVPSPLPRLSEPILKSYAPGSIDIDNERIYDLIGFP